MDNLEGITHNCLRTINWSDTPSPNVKNMWVVYTIDFENGTETRHFTSYRLAESFAQNARDLYKHILIMLETTTQTKFYEFSR